MTSMATGAPAPSAPSAPSTLSAAADTRLPSVLTAATPQRVVTAAGALLVALFVLPAVLSTYWMKIVYEMAAYSLVALGLGLLIGRTGMYSLCHIPMVAAGAWFALRVHFLFDGAPFPIIVLAAGVLTGVLGIVIGLPALRLSGLYLALVTLMAAGAITLLLTVVKFPNSNQGFWGYNKRNPSAQNLLPRPSVATTDIAYYRYTVVILAIAFLVAAWHVAGKPGRAWAAIRQSEVTATAAGINLMLYKLWAFALSAFVTGVAGALVAAGPGGVGAGQFPVSGSIMLLAVVLMGGVYSIWGALVAAFLLRVLPRLLDQLLGLPAEALTVLFGIGIIQVLLTAPGGIIADLERLARGIGSKFRPRAGDEGATP